MNSYDVAIVGGGIIGASIAVELAGVGLRVVVLDRQQLGLEASWAAAGMLSPGPDAPSALPLVPLAVDSFRKYPQFVADLESASGQRTFFARPGSLELFTGADALQHRDAMAAEHSALGLTIESITLDAARNFESAIGPEVRAAAWLPDEATIEPRRLMACVLASCESRGVEFRTDHPVTSFLVDGGRCLGVVANNEKISARHVVLAAGSFCGPLAAQLPGITLSASSNLAPTHPVRGQMLALRSNRVNLSRVLRSEKAYLVPRHDGTLVAGSTLEDAGFQKEVTAEGRRKILDGVTEMVPELADAEIIDSWSGLRPGTPDALPIIGESSIAGLLIATGHYRNGILLAPATAAIIRDLIVEGKTNFNIAPYSALRFSEKSEARTAPLGASANL